MKKIVFIIFTLLSVHKSFGQNPTVTLKGIPDTLCQNYYFLPSAIVSSCSLSGNPNTYSWSFPDGEPSSSTLSNPPHIYYYTDGKHTVTLTVKNDCGTTTVDSTIIMKTVPVPNPIADIVVCSGDQVPAIPFSSATPGAKFYWDNSNIDIGLMEWNGGTNQLHTFTSGKIDAVAKITLSSYIHLSCPGAKTYFNITVATIPAAPASNDVEYCQNASALPLTATVTGTNVLFWYTVATGGTSSLSAPTPSTATPGVVKYYVSQGHSNSNCDGPRTLINVTTNANINIGSKVNNTTSCLSSTGSIVLTGFLANTSYQLTYTKNPANNNSLNLISDASGNITINNLSAGTYSAIQVNLSACATGNSVGPIVISDPEPPGTPTVSSNSPVCSSNNINLTANATGTGSINYTWTGPLNFSSNDQNPTILNSTYYNGGTYSVIATQNNCASPVVSVNVVVNYTPDGSYIRINNDDKPNVCAGKTLTLTATPGFSSYKWLGPGLKGTDTNQTLILPDAQTSQGGDYIIYVYNGACASGGNVRGVNIMPTPVISSAVVNNTTNCFSSTGSIDLYGMMPNNYYTLSYNTSTATITGSSLLADNNGIISITGLSAGIYSSINLSWYGCTSANVGPLKISDPKPPVIAPSSTAVICSGNNLNLLANVSTTNTGTISYNWTGPSNYTSTSQNPVITNSTTTESGDYTLIATQNSCPSTAGTVSVVVKQTPSTPVISSNSPVCSGNTIALTGPSGAAVYNWSGPGFSISNTSQSPSITNAALSAAGTYALIITNTGCSSLPATTNVVINATPSISTLTNNGAICSGATLNFSWSTDFSGPLSYAWSGPNGFSSIIQNPSIIYAPATSGGNYNLIIKSIAGNCPSATAITTATVNPTPSITSSIGTAPTDCFSANGFIRLNGLKANTTYLVQYIKNNDPATSINLTASGGGVIIIPNLSAATFTNISVTLNNCISNTIAQVIIVAPVPATPNASSNAPICDKINNLNLFASTITTGVFNYSWTGPGLYTSNQQNPSIASVSQAAAGTYYVVISYNNCVSATGSTNVIINSTPDAPSISSNSPVCSSTPLNLKSSTSFVGGLNYSWQGPNSFTSTNASPILNNTTLLAAGKYQLKITSVTGNCAGATSENIVEINPTPVISSSTFINPISCNSSTGSIQLKGLIAGTVYQTSYTTGAGVLNSVAITADAAGTIVISNLTAQAYSMVQVTLAGCSTPGFNIILTDPPIPAAPSVSIGGIPCLGSSVQLSATTTTIGTLTYKWNFPNGEINTSQNPIILNAGIANNGNYLVTVTQNSCESAATNLLVSLHQPPAAPGVSAVALCINTTANQLTATSEAGNILNWYTAASGGIGISIALTPATITAGEQNFYVSQKDNYGCESNRASLLVTINPDAIAQFDPPVLVKCGVFIVGNSDIGLKPYPNNNSEYKWYVNNLFIGSGAVFPGYTIAENSNATIVLNAVSKFGCKENSSTQILSSLSPKPSFTASLNEHCGSFSAQFTNTSQGTLGLAYHWDFGNGQTFDGVTPGLINFLADPVPGININYKVVLTVNSVCGPVSSIQYVLVKSLPTVGFSFPNITVCTNQKVVFNNESNGAANYTWIFGDGTTRTVFTTDTIQYSYSGNIMAAFTIKLIATAGNGCSAAIVKNRNIYPAPVIAITADKANCVNKVVNFSSSILSTDPIKSSQWDISNGISLLGGSASYVFKTPGNYVVKYIATTLNGCSDTAYHTIQIKPTPVVDGGPPVFICKGNSVTLNATSNANFEWSPSLGLSCTDCMAPLATPNITTSYVLQATLNGCMAADTVMVTVIQPFKLFKSGIDTICIGQSIKLNITGAPNYKWTPVTGLSNTAIGNPIATPIASTAYTVVGYDGYKCFTDTAYRVVTVGLLPIVSLGPDKILANGTNYQMVSTVSNGPIVTWLWFPANNLDCANCPNPIASIRNNISYILKATSNYGCIGVDTINIKASCESNQVFVPNAFTPDGDGVNDVLMIRSSGLSIVKHFTIYNKWGEVVFERNNFSPNDPKMGWDGQIKGKPGFAEVYVYTAEVICENGVSFTYKGNTTLIK